MSGKILVSDFDGTMTRTDFYRLALARLPAASERHWQRYQAGEISHFSALAAVFSELRVDEMEYDRMLEEMELEPGLTETCRMLGEGGWSLAIASAGCDCYIQPLLAKQGIVVPVHANPGYYSPSEGVVMRLPGESPYYSPDVGIDKDAIVRDLLLQGWEVAYAGDGRPDLAPLLRLPAARRFARGWLASELRRRNEPFTWFGSWRQIVVTLVSGVLTRV